LKEKKAAVSFLEQSIFTGQIYNKKTKTQNHTVYFLQCMVASQLALMAAAWEQI
jgi:hypothetical protein